MDEAPPYDDTPPAPPTRSAAPTAGRTTTAPANEAAAEQDELEEEPEEVFDPALGYLLEDVDHRWLTVVREAAGKSRPLAAHLAHARFCGVEKAGGRVVVNVLFDRRPNLDTVSEAAARGELLEALAPFGEGAVLFAKLRDGEASAAPSIAEAQRAAAAKAQADLEAHAKAHPVVKKALELFGGEVRQVRRET